MNDEQIPKFSTDQDEAMRALVLMAASNGVSNAAEAELLRVGFRAGASWAFTVAAHDAKDRAEAAMRDMLREQRK